MEEETKNPAEETPAVEPVEVPAEPVEAETAPEVPSEAQAQLIYLVLSCREQE